MYLVKSLRLFVGTSAERTTAGLGAFLPGDEYHETDTSDTYQHDGMAWIQKNTGGTPGGSDTQIQFNDGGAFGGDDALVWDKTDNILTIEKLAMTPPTYSPFTALALHNGDITLVSDSPATLSLEWRVAGEAAADPRARITYNSTTNALDFRTDGAMNFITAGSVYVWQFLSGAVNVNPQGGDIDFFVESDTYPFMLNVDAGADLVTIGTASQGTIAQFGNGGIVFNNEEADRDFRIAGNTATNLFVADAGLDTVRIGTTVAGDIAQFGPLGLVLNTGQANIDFRLAGDGVANGIYYDASENRTGFNTNSPNTNVDINGSASFRVNSVALSNGGNHNVNIGNYTWVRATGPTAAFTVTGFTGGADGRILIFAGAVAQAMTIANNSASSTAGNRIFTTTGADVVLGNVGKAIFIYDGTSSAWRMFMGNGSNGAQ